MDFLSLDPLLKQALQEDLGRGDITTEAILGMSGPSRGGAIRAQAVLLAKENFVLAGWPIFVRVFQLLGEVEAQTRFEEGAQVEQESTVGKLSGAASVLLRGERVAMNFLQRMSGVATQTRKYVELVAHTTAKVLDTRKTTPLWRSLEKYAVRTGGGFNHRLGLDDGILIKENHIAMAGGIGAALDACRSRMNHLHKIEIEVRNLEELSQAINAGAEVLLLDNMTTKQVQEAVKIAKGRCVLEVSGGVNESNIVEYAEAGVDLISLGILTHSSPSVDLSVSLHKYDDVC
ncbi:MAG: carboxylating nicotinate-nucleotide diphosphorylase [Acidobacteria bacterium]|nr:carboxylating nicotinate-nucleotide diphosphorylase [Acidobacteriota bacterium]